MIKIYNPKTNNIQTQQESKILIFLYHNLIGRVILKIITIPLFSKIFSLLTKSRFSKIFIKKFIKNNNIDMSEYPFKNYCSFNDFFTRKINLTYRPYLNDTNCLISPCDAKLSAYKINHDLSFKIKNSIYTVASLIEDEELAKEYENGYCLVFRLTVDDYHHYHFIDDGKIKSHKKISGILHTVNPIAHTKYKVYAQNSREVSITATSNFDQVIYIEVGALNVGKINNYYVEDFHKFQEKGYFSFGASTVILLFKKNIIDIETIYLTNTQNDIETIVKLGEKIGHKKNTIY